MFNVLDISLITHYSIREILLFFVIYSFLGWLIESTYVSITNKKLVNSGFLYGPFCPIYGAGAVILVIILEPFTNHFLHIFVISFFIISIWEYYVGYMMELLFGLKWWDYSSFPLNIHGRICLLFSFAWGILGVSLITIVHPFIREIVSIKSSGIIDTIIIVFILYYLIDSIFSAIKALKVKEFLNKKNKSLLEYLTDKIKTKINKTKY